MRQSELASYRAQKQEEKNGNKNEALQLKFQGDGQDFPNTPKSDWGNQPSRIKAQHNLPEGISVPDDRWSEDISQDKLQMYGIIFFQY